MYYWEHQISLLAVVFETMLQGMALTWATVQLFNVCVTWVVWQNFNSLLTQNTLLWESVTCGELSI
jgi:hypothetical protein